MKVLVIGSGGREHALTWAIAKDKKVKKIFCAPGNAGTSEIAENVSISAENIDELLKFAKENDIDLTVVGPEVPLINGITDVFEETGLKIFGPDKDASQLEGSKSFTKNLLKKNNIPTASFFETDLPEKAKEFIKNTKYPVVIKADGLAAGKGVIICANKEEANKAIEDIMIKKIFGKSGERIVIEEFLKGEEASILAFTDGNTILTLPPSQDHKKIYDDDKGPNTGGMGAYAPTPLITKKLEEKIIKKVLYPTLEGLKREGIIYKGIMYAGLMIVDGEPFVLEYNVRFGDPETQAVLPLLKSNIIDLFFSTIEGNLKNEKIEINDKYAINVVLASKGYPGAYEKGKVIKGLEYFKGREDMIVFHAGTTKKGNEILTSGGRVLNVTAIDNEIESAINKVYSEINKINFEGMYFRTDIGKKALKYK
jgi:phosphoribosylamine--glycine ligase